MWHKFDGISMILLSLSTVVNLLLVDGIDVEPRDKVFGVLHLFYHSHSSLGAELFWVSMNS